MFALFLAVVSAVALTISPSGAIASSAMGSVLHDFAQPGTTIWWFVLGGPFRSAPSSFVGIAFAAVANGLFWVVLCWLGVSLVRLVGR